MNSCGVYSKHLFSFLQRTCHFVKSNILFSLSKVQVSKVSKVSKKVSSVIQQQNSALDRNIWVSTLIHLVLETIWVDSGPLHRYVHFLQPVLLLEPQTTRASFLHALASCAQYTPQKKVTSVYSAAPQHCRSPALLSSVVKGRDAVFFSPDILSHSSDKCVVSLIIKQVTHAGTWGE